MSIRIDLGVAAALVTGASSGLGAHFARLLAANGAKVALAARRLDRLTVLAGEIEGRGGRALPVECDVIAPASVEAAVSAAETELGPITILVNNSGVAVAKRVLETSETEWDQVLDTNLKGAFLMAQAVAIVNIASIVGLRSMGQLASYAASKAGLIHLTRNLALELAPLGIRVNALAPGYIETDINRDFLAGPAGQAITRRIPA